MLPYAENILPSFSDELTGNWFCCVNLCIRTCFIFNPKPQNILLLWKMLFKFNFFFPLIRLWVKKRKIPWKCLEGLKRMFVVSDWGREGEQKEWRSESEVTTKKAKVLSVLIVFRYWGDGILWLSVDFHY